MKQVLACREVKVIFYQHHFRETIGGVKL